MTDSVAASKRLIILAILVPVAGLIGYLLAEGDFLSFALLGALLVPLVAPVLLRWHHFLLALSWNLSLIMPFLPGSPPLWMLMGWISFGLVVLARALDRNTPWLNAPEVTWSLVALTLIVLFTMKMTGTIGVRSLGGSAYGGKKYFFILFSVVAFFGLSTSKIPLAKAKAYLTAYFLPGISPVLSNIIYTLGPAFWILFAFIPTDAAISQATEDFSLNAYAPQFKRISGLSFASIAAVSFLLARFGIKGLLDLTKPWRILLLAVSMAASLFGGFRSVFLLNCLMLTVMFFFEGLHRTKLFPALILTSLISLAAVYPISNKLPFSAQRAISFLPGIEVNNAVRADALGSIDWRLEMWQLLWHEVPEYFWVGKGYTASATEYYLASEAVRRDMGKDLELSMIAGDYHSGLLSILIPFGIFGVLAFVVLLWAGLRVLILNFQNGPPELRTINTFLLSLFAVRIFFYFAVFGSIHSDLGTFLGILGLSMALNHGVCRTPKIPMQAGNASIAG